MNQTEKLVAQLSNQDTLRALARSSGASKKEVQSVLAAAVPTLLTGMQLNSGTKSGEVALEKARFLAAEASGPIELTKKILSEGLDEALADEQTFQGLLFTTSDFQEGRAAFLEKRKPNFGG